MALSFELLSKVESKAYQMREKVLKTSEGEYSQRSGLNRMYKNGEKKYHATELDIIVKNKYQKEKDTPVYLEIIETGTYEKIKNLSKEKFVDYYFNMKSKGDKYNKDIYEFEIHNAEFGNNEKGQAKYIEQGYYIRRRVIEHYTSTLNFVY